MIPKILDDTDAATVLINAICFKALWEEPFEEMRRMPFENADKSKVMLPGMSRHAYMMVEQWNHFVVLGMNYCGGRYKMLILLPNENYSVDHVLNNLSATQLEWLLKSRDRSTETYLRMPKFKMQFKQSFIPILQQMGIRKAFTPLASFGRMAYKPLFISKVEQRSYIEVNEKGTEAAAATEAEMAIGAVDFETNYLRINVDRPFMFVIGDSQTGIPLFMGEYRGDEKAEKI